MPITAQRLARLERKYPDGLTMSQILGALAKQGIHVPETTFRKYVQLGLLPQSRRIRRSAGRHTGSHGLYPTETVRYLLLIKEKLRAGAGLSSLQRTFRRQSQIAEISYNLRRIRALLSGEVSDAELRALDAKIEDLVRRLLLLNQALS